MNNGASFAAFLLGVAVVVVLASSPGCGGTVSPLATDGGPGVAAPASAEGIGDSCIPTQEGDPAFLAFDEQEVNLETNSPSCRTGVCLVNHFRGRVSCPYGQDPSGQPPIGAEACVATGSGSLVIGGSDPRRKAQVPPQCVDRAADNTVYCSCRCANLNGNTDDGAPYCACSAGFECTPLVASIGKSNDDLAGSYCVKKGTLYDTATACNQGGCDPVAKKCL